MVGKVFYPYNADDKGVGKMILLLRKLRILDSGFSVKYTLGALYVIHDESKVNK